MKIILLPNLFCMLTGWAFFAGEVNSQEIPPWAPKFQAEIRQSPLDPTRHEIFVTDLFSNQTTRFLTLSGTTTQIPLIAKYAPGSVWLVFRSSSPEGWQDTLWRYDKKGYPQKIVSGLYLDFFVSEDGRSIAAIHGQLHENLIILQKDGTVLKSYSLNNQSDLTFTDFDTISPHFWLGNTFWATSDVEAVGGVMKIMVSTNGLVGATTFHAYFSSLDYALNPVQEMIAYSDYPQPVDFDDEKLERQWKQNRVRVSLYLYDLRTGKQKEIASSKQKQFEPRWLNEHTLEFNDPKGPGRMHRKILNIRP